MQNKYTYFNFLIVLASTKVTFCGLICFFSPQRDAILFCQQTFVFEHEEESSEVNYRVQLLLPIRQ